MHRTSTTTPQGHTAGIALFALGFRPFFLLAAVGTVVFMLAWLGFYFYNLPAPHYYGPLVWHGHEMLFGYTVAVVAGFLLTAVRNWTGEATPAGAPLAALASLWLAGRILPFVPFTPDWVIAIVDLSFLPALGAAIAPPLWRAGQRHNRIFLVLLALLTLANLIIHVDRLHLTTAAGSALTGLQLAVGVIIVLITIVGGRVIPFFIERGIDVTLQPRPWLDRLAIASAAGWLAASVFAHGTVLHASMACAALVINALRLVAWYHRRLWAVPLLWVLYMGYAWLVVGFALDGAAVAGWIAAPLAMHAFTAGTIGITTLGMMARVALGHTGRAMRAAPATVASFVLINVAAFFRVALPLVAPAYQRHWILAAGLLWIAAFLLFLSVYVPVLIRPRIDGRPG